MYRCWKIECNITPYSYNSQSFADCKPVSSGADGPTKNAISLTLFIRCCLFVGSERESKWSHKKCNIMLFIKERQNDY